MLLFSIVMIVFFVVLSAIIYSLFQLVKNDTFSYDEKFLWNNIETLDLTKKPD